MPKIQYKEINFRGKSLDLINLVNQVINEYKNQGYELTLRQTYYQLVARGYIPNNERSYKNIGNLINDGRLAGLIDWYSIVDRTRNLRGNNHWDKPEDVIASARYSYLLNKWDGQPNYVEVWVEKDALVDIVGQACIPLDTPYFSCRGYTSQSEMWSAAQRFIDQSYRDNCYIIHLGDHDPSGIDMTRDIQERLQMFGADVYDLQFMPHQEEVLNLTDDKNRCAYYLDMGLGKTFVGAEKMYLLNNTINLIVCQKSKIDDWVDHIKTYYPEYRVMDLTKKSEGVNFRTLVETKDLYDQNIQIVGVINYDLVFRRKYIAHITDFTLLLDESSLICNENAKRSKFILKLQPESVILLSGTPTAGKYERLWSQLKLLGWDINKKAFYASYVQTEWIENGDGYKKEVITGYKHVEHLKKRLTQFGAVFMKTEEVIELPEQTEQKIFLKITNEYKFFIKHNYLELDTRNLVRFKDDSDFEGEDVTPRVELIGDNSLTKTLYCRQLCGQWHKEKLEAFRDLLESTEDRLIVFYNFNEELTRLRKICESLNREVSFVNGSGRSMYAYECVDNSVTFVQYQAGAMGGNYQKANKIVYFTLPLGKGSCDLWEQSKKRIHRIGQNRPCFYYYLLVKGSFEERNLAALQEGKELTDELFNT